MEILPAVESDLAEILNLQKLAYRSEAEIYNDYEIAPLTQTLEELKAEAKNSTILKAIDGGKIIGSVRAMEQEETCYVNRLMVHPDYRNRGIGKQLMAAIEKCFDVYRYELFTGHLSKKNLALYERLGYKKYKLEKVNDNLQFVYLEK